MKKLFTSIMMLCAAVSMGAQDAPEWEEGQEVTGELEWVNTKYEGDDSGWTYYNAGGNGVGYMYDAEKCPTGSIEMYNNAIGSEYYQVFWLPAGYYKFTVQGFYRPGSAWAAGWDTNTDQNGYFFCDAVNVEDDVDENGEIIGVKYTTTNESSAPLRLIVSDAHQGDEKILTDEMCGDWQRDNGFTKDGLQYWVPNSMWGSCLYFDMGNYENELMVINPTDSYVKIGIRKGPDSISDDWIIFNNFRAYYISDAGEAVQLLLAQENVRKAEKEVETLQQTIQASYGSLALLLGDEVMAIQDADEYDSSIEACAASVEKINNLMAEYKKYYEDAKTLSILIKKCETLNNVAQDATFSAAVAAALAVANDGNGQEEMTISSPEAYKNAEVALAEARIAYLTSTEAVNGAWDFSTMINYPWFCNEEYNPTYNAEEGRWYFPETALNGDEDHAGFANYFEGNATYAGGSADDGRPYLIIADQVKLATKEVPGQWYQVGTSAYEPYWNHQYSSAKQWATPGENREIVQIVTGLPNGFYAAKGLGMTWGNDWDKDGIDPTKTCNMGVYIEAGEEKSVSTEAPIFSGWWQGGHPFDWVTYTTSMVRVTDGTVKVAFFANGFSSFTGMQLYYYGENPDFTAMLTPEIAAVKNIDLILAGDKAKVDELLAQVPAKVEGYEQFDAARKIVNEAMAYATNSSKFMETWAAEQQFMTMQSQYEEGTLEAAMIDPAIMYALDYPSHSDATYIGAQAIDNAYKAYENYFNTRATMLPLAETNDELEAVLYKQAEAMKASYADAATISAYLAELAAPYNAAVMASLGADKASESNPVDITTLLVNPSFENGNTGWEGSFTVDGNFKNAESWNTSAFRAAQTVYNLPAGSYRIQAQAFYRDGGDAGTSFDNYVYFESYTPNVKLFANDNSTDVVSLCSETFTEPSMTERVKEWVRDDVATDAWHDLHQEDPDYDPDYVVYAPVMETIEENPNHPFDQCVSDEADYWYPNSMEGAMNRFQKSPEAYINNVEIFLSAAGNITFGVEKFEGIGADWCIFDNFKLFYLGAEPTTGINSTVAGAKASEIYSVSGVRQSTLSRGVNIIKMSDGTVTKVIKK